MRKGPFSKTSPLFAAAVAVAGAGLFTTAAPAQAADCQQWGFPGPVALKMDTGEILNFTASGSHAGAPADWDHGQGSHEKGTVSGDITPEGGINLTFVENGTAINFNGTVAPDGTASGIRDLASVPWHSLAPMTCTQSGPKEGPSLALDPGVGTLTIHITDHSGVASNCQYSSDFVNRKFHLPANGTTDINVVPAVPLFIDHQVDITCDNGTGTHTSAFF